MTSSSWRPDRPSLVNWNRIWLALASILFVTILGFGGFKIVSCSFPVETLQEDGSFRDDDIGWLSRIDIHNAVRERRIGSIKLVIYAHGAFHVFDTNGKVFVVGFGESGAEPPAYVLGVESYTGDPHKHPFRQIGGA